MEFISLSLIVVFVLACNPTSVQGNQIASWWVDTDVNYAPQVFQYDETSSRIYYSLCNSLIDPIFAQNASTALETAIAPVAGTSIASLGYLSESEAGSTTLHTNVFYLADLAGTGTTVASASYACNTTTGRWDPAAPPTGGSYNQYISNGTNCATTAPSIDPAGGLSAFYISETDGMRVFFKTAEYQTHYLQYQWTTDDDDDDDDDEGDCMGWSYVGIASNLTTGHEVTSSLRASSSNPHVWTIAQTVFVNASTADADTEGEIEISTANARATYNLWAINRLPTQIIANDTLTNTLEGILTNQSTAPGSSYTFQATNSWGFTFSAFDGATSKLGLADNSDGYPSVFYLGTDGYLRRFSADGLGHWHANASQDSSKWPVADVAASSVGPDFGIAYDYTTNRIWMHYVSDGAMVQLYQSAEDNWQDATTLATANDTNFYWKDASSSSSSSSSNDGSSGSGSNSSTSATLSTANNNNNNNTANKTALGVGIGLGIPLVCLVVAGLWFFLRRRRSRQQTTPNSYTAQSLMAQQHHHQQQQQCHGDADWSDTPTPPQNQGYWQDGVWVEQTATNYYAKGGPGSQGPRRAAQLGELPAAMPMYEMPTDR